MKELRNLRQLAWSVIPGGVSLAAAFFFGGSWCLAERIRCEALAVGPGPAMPAYDDVQFAGVSSEQVQLRAVGDQPVLLKPMLRGIAWPGGVGHLGAVASVSGGVITRPLTVICGSAPAVGQLGGTFVIGVHGQNGTRKDVLPVIDIVYRMGFPALAVTYRNDLGATRDPSGYLRYGQTEWSDIEAAVHWSLVRGARSVVLVGQSIGAGVVAAFLALTARSDGGAGGAGRADAGPERGHRLPGRPTPHSGHRTSPGSVDFGAAGVVRAGCPVRGAWRSVRSKRCSGPWQLSRECRGSNTGSGFLRL